MNEIFDGTEREKSMSYTVSAMLKHDNSRDFTDPKEAAQAFYEIDANDRPIVVLTQNGPEYSPAGNGRIIAYTTGRGTVDKMEYTKFSSDRDPDFDSAYRELTGERAPKSVHVHSWNDIASDNEIAARKSIDNTFYALMAVPNDGLDAAPAHDHVRDDIAALREIKNKTERYYAAVTIGEIAENQASYNAELKRQDTAIAKEVEAATAENSRRIEQKEERKRIEWEVMAGNPEVAAERAISTRSQEAQSEGRTVKDMEPEAARRMAVEDLEDIRKIKMHERLDDAAIVINSNMKNAAYKAEFERIDPEAANAVTLLATQAGERLVPEVSRQETTMSIDDATLKRLAAVRERDSEEARRALDIPRDENKVSEQFVADLDKRMEKAQLEELGWRNRDDLDDVMRDMEKLAAQDWQRAAALWDKYRPGEIDKPIFIDGDDVDEKSVARGAANRQEEVPKHDTNKEVVALEALRKRFLHTDNKFYFRDSESKLAFEDTGKRLATEHDDPHIIRSMVDLAEAKGWNSIKLTGTDDFKREAWLQASLKGLEVRGFKPQKVDLARLEDHSNGETRPNKSLNAIEQTVEREAVIDEQQRTLSEKQRTAIETLKAIMKSRGDSEKVIDMASKTAAEKFQTNRVYVGKVLEHGAAPYENVKENENSYYVKLLTGDAKEKVIWGVDLKRAFEEDQTKVGDHVVLAYQGRQQVTVKVKEKDDQGKVIGVKEIPTNRNVWDVKQIDNMREEALRHFADKAENNRQPQVSVYDSRAPSSNTRPEITRETKRDSERERG